jgi:hypothetical protein
LFRSKAIAAFATVACVFTAQQGSAGNAEFIAARPTLMVLPMVALAPVVVAASATGEAAVFDYDSPARQIVFPVLEEQMLRNGIGARVPVPSAKPNRAVVRTNREFRAPKIRPTAQVARVIRAKAEPKRFVAVSSLGLTNPMQPIIGAFR